jgi:hypothetical protein
MQYLPNDLPAANPTPRTNSVSQRAEQLLGKTRDCGGVTSPFRGPKNTTTANGGAMLTGIDIRRCLIGCCRYTATHDET